MTRDEVIALIVAKAQEHGLVPWEFLGGAIAESNLDPDAWRQGVWPDWSAGLFQQTVEFADEGDHTASDENVALIKRLYFDPAYACDVAAKKYRYWRYDPEVPAEQAWSAYNWPGSYKHYTDNPNLGNYRAGLAEAQRILGASPVIDTVLQYNPDQPPERQVQDWACSIRTLTWMLKSLGVQIEAGALQDEMVPDVVTPAVGLLDGRGNGLAAIMRRHVPESVGVTVTWAPDWETLTSLAGTGPIGIGSGSLYHWLAVAAPIDATTVRTANPAPNYPPGDVLGDTLTRDQFNRYAPWAMVRGELGAAPAPSPAPPSGQPDVVQSGPFAGLSLPELQAKAEGLVVTLADVSDRLGDQLAGYSAAISSTIDQIRAEREQALGKRA